MVKDFSTGAECGDSTEYDTTSDPRDDPWHPAYAGQDINSRLIKPSSLDQRADYELRESAEPVGDAPSAASEGQDIEEAARDAAADVAARAITDVVMRGVSLFVPGSGSVAAGAAIDNLNEVLQDLVDPARLPAEAVGKATFHVVADLLIPSIGPFGIAIAFVVGEFTEDLTHQLLDDGEDTSDVQDAEAGIEVAGVVADGCIGRLAESEPFSEFISGLAARSIAENLPGGERASATGGEQELTITAVAAVYGVRRPADRMRPVSVTAFTRRPASPTIPVIRPEEPVPVEPGTVSLVEWGTVSLSDRRDEYRIGE